MTTTAVYGTAVYGDSYYGGLTVDGSSSISFSVSGFAYITVEISGTSILSFGTTSTLSGYGYVSSAISLSFVTSGTGREFLYPFNRDIRPTANNIFISNSGSLSTPFGTSSLINPNDPYGV